MGVSECVPACSRIYRLSQNSIVIARVPQIAGTHWNTPPKEAARVELNLLLVLIWMPSRAPPLPDIRQVN